MNDVRLSFTPWSCRGSVFILHMTKRGKMPDSWALPPHWLRSTQESASLSVPKYLHVLPSWKPSVWPRVSDPHNLAVSALWHGAGSAMRSRL